MSDFTFSLVLPSWIAQWYVHRCGGLSPVRTPKGSVESIIIQRFSRPKSEASAPDTGAEGAIMIIFPENKAKPTAVYNYFPDSAKKILARSISDQFNLCLFNDIVRPLFNNALKSDLIWAWMEENGIERTETNWLGIEKRYSRMRENLLRSRRVQKTRKKTSEL